jgi:hypothetical protein
MFLGIDANIRQRVEPYQNATIAKSRNYAYEIGI